ncbi:hypothetical protein ASG51_10405 [Methylobacterium sp. Leaf465]|uniref:DUF2459 domain-containing protein n=1 Tax=Methylobacterium sp. Leaf465 TaxID=1736385 RepID=UPI0006F38730|nr:DUF2459 domain-containing protein [Methylobacterium sp. Leaf465]KQT71348.1 hypothetical protein ASG51_10405 [Methylobacterium sp. Leaf465]
MRTGRWGLARIVAGLAALIVTLVGLVVLAALLTAQRGDPDLYPPADADSIGIALVSHGWHSGLVLPRAALTGAGSGPALASIATQFRAYPQIEFGWGEARFYRATPTLAQFDLGLALAALFTPGGRAGVVQVVGLERPVRDSFPYSDLVPLRVSKPGLARLLARLEGSFRLVDGQPAAGGPGLYGPSLFYDGAGRFSYANVCNHWAARLLHAAGLPITPVLDTHPAGLLLDLHWRSGLAPQPPTANLSKP